MRGQAWGEEGGHVSAGTRAVLRPGRASLQLGDLVGSYGAARPVDAGFS